jgi:hypothetical protein
MAAWANEIMGSICLVYAFQPPIVDPDTDGDQAAKKTSKKKAHARKRDDKDRERKKRRVGDTAVVVSESESDDDILGSVPMPSDDANV